MSNVIDFLERMGQDAQLRHAVGDEVQRALVEAGIDPAVRAAILDADQPRLEALLGATANVCCMIQRPDQGDEDDDDDRDDDEDDDGDDEDEDPKSQRYVGSCAAPAR